MKRTHPRHSDCPRDREYPEETSGNAPVDEDPEPAPWRIAVEKILTLHRSARSGRDREGGKAEKGNSETGRGKVESPRMCKLRKSPPSSSRRLPIPPDPQIIHQLSTSLRKRESLPREAEEEELQVEEEREAEREVESREADQNRLGNGGGEARSGIDEEDPLLSSPKPPSPPYCQLPLPLPKPFIKEQDGMQEPYAPCQRSRGRNSVSCEHASQFATVMPLEGECWIPPLSAPILTHSAPYMLRYASHTVSTLNAQRAPQSAPLRPHPLPTTLKAPRLDKPNGYPT